MGSLNLIDQKWWNRPKTTNGHLASEYDFCKV